MFLEKAYTGKNQWYLYIFSLLIIFVATQIGTLPVLAYMLINKVQDLNVITSTNLGLALILLSFVAGFWAVLLCVRYVHRKKYTDIITGRSKIDWKRIFFGAGIWGGLLIIGFILQLTLTDSQGLEFHFEPFNFFMLLLISLTLFPFQTTFEELIFRGYLMQWSVLLFKYRWAAVLFTGLLFGAMHGANPEVDYHGVWIAMPQYILMGLIMGYIAVKDDGIELVLGFHMVNNILSAITVTSKASALQTHALFIDHNPSSSYLDSVVILVTGLIFIWICNRKYHFEGKVNLWAKVEAPTLPLAD